MNKVFETLENFALVLIVVLGGFMTGFGASLVSSSPRVITPESLATSSSVVDYTASATASYSTTFLSTEFITAFPGFTTATSMYVAKNWNQLTQTADKPMISNRFAILRDTNGYMTVGYSSYYNSANYVNTVNDTRSNAVFDGRNFFTWSVDYVYSGLYVYDVDWDISGNYTQSYIGVSVYNPDEVHGFECNFTAVSLGAYNSSVNPLRFFTGYVDYAKINSGYFNWMSFRDNHGVVITFYIPVYYASSSTQPNRPYWYYSDTTYYLYDGSIDDSSNNYYQQGYDTGYNTGYNVGYDGGYSTGSDDGYNTGYNTGYNQALTDDHYTFINFLGAVVDAPVQAFRSLFDLEILGVNMLDFFSALLSICIVLLVIKFVFLR